MADRRASRSRRMASTTPSWLFGVPAAVPDNAPSCRLSIDGVGLTTLTAELTIWTIHLDNADARRPKVAHEPGAVAACTLHTDADQRPVAGEPGQELVMTGARRRKQSCSEQLPSRAQCRG